MYFEQYIKERNIKPQTIKQYKLAIKKYTNYFDMTFDELIEEAINEEEDTTLSRRHRSIKTRLLQFRTHLMTETDLKTATVKKHMQSLHSLYKQFDIEIPELPPVKEDDIVETTYFDLPTKKQVAMAIDISGIRLSSLILFMVSSGTAREECSNITIQDFLNACEDYYTSEDFKEILDELYSCEEPLVPTFDIIRTKTQKRYNTFCTPEAAHSIVEWLMLRLEMCELNEEELDLEDKLWGWTPRQITYHFTHLNDELGFGFKGSARFFRPHTLRKFHASNMGLTADRIDALQGRSKNKIHATYIKNNPTELKEIYMNFMENVVIGNVTKKEIVHEEYNINININFYGNEYGVSL